MYRNTVVAHSNNKSRATIGLVRAIIVATKLDGKTYKATIKDNDVQLFKDIAETDALKKCLRAMQMR
jgi:hypothetical protein